MNFCKHGFLKIYSRCPSHFTTTIPLKLQSNVLKIFTQAHIRTHRCFRQIATGVKLPLNVIVLKNIVKFLDKIILLK